jgi:hypothetical protein
MIEGVAVGTRTVPVEELEARRSAVFNALSFLIRAGEWQGGEQVTREDARLARAVSGELAWVHEWLAELIREHADWVKELRG